MTNDLDYLFIARYDNENYSVYHNRLYEAISNKISKHIKGITGYSPAVKLTFIKGELSEYLHEDIKVIVNTEIIDEKAAKVKIHYIYLD